MNEPLVSIIIPAYNAEEHIRECIDSVVGQIYKTWEAFVVVSPSTDNTLDILKEYSGDPRIHIIQEPNKSNCATARNVGFREVTGKYVTLLDSDDWWYMDRLSTQVEFMEKHPDIAWSMHYLMVKGVSGKIKIWETPIQTSFNGATFGGMHTILFKKEVLDKVKEEWWYLFNENMSHTDDTDLVARIGKYPHAMIPKPMSGFRRNKKGLSFGVNANDIQMTTVKIAIRNRAYSILEFVDYVNLPLQIINKTFGCDIVAFKKRWFG